MTSMATYISCGNKIYLANVTNSTQTLILMLLTMATRYNFTEILLESMESHQLAR